MRLHQHLIPSSDLIIVHLLGEGSFGQVYKADFVGTTVALKRMKAVNISPEVLKDAQAECEIMLQLRHPAVVQLYGICAEVANSFAMVLEFCDRGSLEDKIQNAAFLMSWSDRKMTWAQEVAVAMAFLHSKLIVHMDLKPENVMLGDDMHAKLADFGTSRQVNNAEDKIYEVMGTPIYMAPEVYLQEGADWGCDCYSYGILLCPLHTEKTPYAEFE